MIQFRHNRTGRVVDVPDKSPVERRTVELMDRSRRWSRVEEDTPSPVAAPAEPTPPAGGGFHDVSELGSIDNVANGQDGDPDPQTDAESPSEPVSIPDEIDVSDVQVGATSADLSVAQPSQTDRKADWVDWAVSEHGLSRDEAEGMTKSELVDLSRG